MARCRRDLSRTAKELKMMALMRRSVQGTQPLNGGRSRQLRGKTRQSQDTPVRDNRDWLVGCALLRGKIGAAVA